MCSQNHAAFPFRHARLPARSAAPALCAGHDAPRNLFVFTTCQPLQAGAGPLDGQTLVGAFVTMTSGARCPSTSTITFSTQGEATGPIEGVFDARGTMDISTTASDTDLGIRALSATLDFNRHTVTGSLRWEPTDEPLHLTCDPLTIRIEGRLRYTIGEPFAVSDTLELQAYGSRNTVTQPYFGRIVLVFVPSAGLSK
jgi:hypothetical protein